MVGSAAVNVVLLRLAGFPAGRFVVLLAIYALPMAFALYHAAQVQTQQYVRAGLWRSLLVSEVFGPAVVTVTGGLSSPFIPFVLADAILVVVLRRRRGAVRWSVVGVTTIMCLLAIAPDAVTGPPISRPYLEIMIAFNLAGSLYLAAEIVHAVSEGFLTTRRTLSTVRERVVDSAISRVRSLEQIGSKVAHELENPLAALKSMLQLEGEALVDARHGATALRRDNERSRRRLDTIFREVARIEAVLRDYLSFSRPLEDLRVGPIDLFEIVDSIAILLEGRAAAAGVRLERSGESIQVAADARRLEEALLNIAANAIEATPAGGRVTIKTERRKEGAALVVEDTGRGMSASVLEKVGTPFFTTRPEGTGLGVILARAAVAQHGGRLGFASRPGQGTTVTLELPAQLRITGAIKAGTVESPPPAETASGGSR
jgi:signal transduction histidine kinase